MILASHFPLLRPHVLAHLSTSWSLVVTANSLVVRREACLSASTHIAGRVRIVELLLLSGDWDILAHMLASLICHLAVLQLIGIDHRKHLRETLTNSRNSLRWVTEWQLVPGHVLDALSMHVNKTLLT